MRTPRCTRAHAAFPLRTSEGRGPHGRFPCRVCGGVVKPPRRHYCGEQCSDTVAIVCNPSYARYKVNERDKGVCAGCGCDTARLARVLHSLRRADRGAYFWAIERMQFHDAFDYWQMDHIVAVSEGGGVRRGLTYESAMGNLRTLCHYCHKEETAKLRRRLRAAAASGEGGA